jgi:5-methylcytosine-specific restriction protein A
MIRDALLRVMAEFEDASRQPFKDHSFAHWIRDDIPKIFRDLVPEASRFTIQASPGKGNWVKGPWVAFFDPVVTGTAQEGYYVVYLFSSDMASVTLSLNQGVTALKRELGVPVARRVLVSRAAILAAHVGEEYKARFSDDLIDLRPLKPGSLLELYEHGHAFGVTYGAAALPTEEQLAADLIEILRLYHLATTRGGTSELEPETSAAAGTTEARTLAERRRSFFHKRVERNAKLSKEAKRIHGYSCQVCGFNFAAHYGALGEGYIEAHHKVPLSEIPDDGAVELSPKDDFAVVCANCHRMLHQKGAPKSFNEFIAAHAKRTGVGV